MTRTFIAYCSLIFLVTSCQNPQVRTPTKTSSGSFIEASVARNKLIYKQEKATIETLIKTDSLREYIATESGFWYTITQKDSAASKQYPVVGDLITFTYNVKNLAGNVIVSVLENGIQTYKVDQSNQDLISGIRDGVKLLSPGEKATFIFPSYKAYGYYGIEKKLGTNQPITSDITLVSINQNQ